MPLRLSLARALPRPSLLRPTRRHFIPFPSAPPLTITTARTLPYAPPALYNLVADINAYALYLPYCLASTILTRSPKDNLPTSADLKVGWGQYVETFRSKVVCDRERGVVSADASENALFEVLVARWVLRGLEGGEKTQVALTVEVQFGNPLYRAVAGGVVPKVAEVMVEAFEKRARMMLGAKRVEGK